MEDNRTIALGQLITSLSHYSNILPFYGKYFDWMHIMLRLWKKTNSDWNENIKSFQNLFRSIKWSDDDIEIDQLIEKYLKLKPEFCNLYPYHIKRRILLYIDQEDTITFIQKAKNMQTTHCDLVWIDSMDKIETTKYEDNLKEFLEKTISSRINTFKLRFNNLIHINQYLKALSKCLPWVQMKIHINEFILNGQALKSIIESSRNCPTLAIFDCQVVDLDGFILDTNIDYKIKYLDMSNTI